MNFLRPLLVLSLASVAVFSSCGGGSKSEDPVALCKQGCSKGITLCLADAGAAGETALAFCQTACTSGATGNDGKPCTNTSAIIAAGKMCLSKTTCEDYMACAATIPACMGGGTTGTGGASGTGSGGRSGTASGGASGTGSGGASGTGTGGASGTGTTCDDVLACCNAATNPTYKMICMSQYDGIKAAGDEACAMYFTAQVKMTLCP
jgi:hypothetical protein